MPRKTFDRMSRNDVDRLLRLNVEVTPTCWVWRGSQAIKNNSRTTPKYEDKKARRALYTAYKGEVPKGHWVVSTCGNRLCFNPDHLKAVERREAVLEGASPAAINAAKTHCIRDHALTGANLYVNPKGNRECRTCRRLAVAKHREKRSKYLA